MRQREALHSQLLKEKREAEKKERLEEEGKRNTNLKFGTALAQRKPAMVQEIERKKAQVREEMMKIKVAERNKRARNIIQDLKHAERAFQRKKEIIDLCLDEPPKHTRQPYRGSIRSILNAPQSEEKSQIKYRVTGAFRAYVERQKRRNCDSMGLQAWIAINGATATNIQVDEHECI